MTRFELFELHMKMTREAYYTMKMKNQDYGESDDPFRNFRRHGALGILVRMSDKLSRLETAVGRGLTVKSESVKDTAQDLINYTVLLVGFLEDKDNAKRLVDKIPTGNQQDTRRDNPVGPDARAIPGWIVPAGTANPSGGSGGSGKGIHFGSSGKRSKSKK